RNDTPPRPRDDMYLDNTTRAATRRGFAGRHASSSWELIQTVLLTLLIFFARRAVVQNFKVEGTSMEPTLHNNQFLIINKLTYARIDGTPVERVFPMRSPAEGAPRFLFSNPEHGDIVVFRFPAQPDKDFIKRIIGVPGDTVEVRAGRVYLNGQQQDE